MQGQFDPQEMIDQMVSIIGAGDGKYRIVWPPPIEELIKQAGGRLDSPSATAALRSCRCLIRKENTCPRPQRP
jgi:hypothetical protein